MFDSPFYNYRESFDRGKIVIVTAFFFFARGVSLNTYSSSKKNQIPLLSG